MHEADTDQWLGVLTLLAVMAALGLLFAAAMRLPPLAPGLGRWAGRAATAIAALLLVLCANVALFRNDSHLDLTREQAFTPSAEAMRVVRSLEQDVQLIYFYQNHDPASRAAKTMVELMGRLSPRLHVRTVDPDQNPGLANQYGVRLYNVAVILVADRRMEVVSISDRDIALGILRALRVQTKTVCFLIDHGEYDIDNFEFHTHFEGTHTHSHSVEGAAVVQMDQHGIGRLRRALEQLGIGARKLALAAAKDVPADCAAVVQANPRTQVTPLLAASLRRYLGKGGSYMLLVEPDYVVDEAMASVLAEAGIAIGSGTLIDPSDHYFTDEQMLAISKYAAHPAINRLALSIFPGARPLRIVETPNVSATALLSSGARSYAVTDRLQALKQDAPGERAAWPIGIASQGRLKDHDGREAFRVLVFGDADFASNSFFPYLSNADLVMGGIAWMLREEQGAIMKPPVEVLPTVTLTAGQVRWIFLLTVLGMPGLVILAGGLMWWVRRR